MDEHSLNIHCIPVSKAIELGPRLLHLPRSDLLSIEVGVHIWDSR
jgi:hypothetical protein